MSVKSRPSVGLGRILFFSVFMIEWFFWRLVGGWSFSLICALISSILALPVSALLQLPFVYLSLLAFVITLMLRPHRSFSSIFERRMRLWALSGFHIAQWERQRIRSDRIGTIARLRYHLLAATVTAIPAVAALLVCYKVIQDMNADDHLKNPERVAFILNRPNIPQSVRDIECSATAITDVMISCAFRVDASEFDKLLVGWDFKSEKVSGSGRNFGRDAPVGPEFKAVIRHFVEPESFEHGGRVDVVTDEDRILVVANRFEE
jgi:hypothetical protein